MSGDPDKSLEQDTKDALRRVLGVDELQQVLDRVGDVLYSQPVGAVSERDARAELFAGEYFQHTINKVAAANRAAKSLGAFDFEPVIRAGAFVWDSLPPQVDPKKKDLLRQAIEAWRPGEQMKTVPELAACARQEIHDSGFVGSAPSNKNPKVLGDMLVDIAAALVPALANRLERYAQCGPWFDDFCQQTKAVVEVIVEGHDDAGEFRFLISSRYMERVCDDASTTSEPLVAAQNMVEGAANMWASLPDDVPTSARAAFLRCIESCPFRDGVSVQELAERAQLKISALGIEQEIRTRLGMTTRWPSLWAPLVDAVARLREILPWSRGEGARAKLPRSDEVPKP
jgi:hypothetical protein